MLRSFNSTIRLVLHCLTLSPFMYYIYTPSRQLGLTRSPLCKRYAVNRCDTVAFCGVLYDGKCDGWSYCIRSKSLWICVHRMYQAIPCLGDGLVLASSYQSLRGSTEKILHRSHKDNNPTIWSKNTTLRPTRNKTTYKLSTTHTRRAPV